MNIARQSHKLRTRLENKYRRKMQRMQRPMEQDMFYTIESNGDASDIIKFRRHRHITVH